MMSSDASAMSHNIAVAVVRHHNNVVRCSGNNPQFITWLARPSLRAECTQAVSGPQDSRRNIATTAGGSISEKELVMPAPWKAFAKWNLAANPMAKLDHYLL